MTHAECDELRAELDSLREENRRLAALARFPEENPSPVLRLDQDGAVVYANQAAAPLLAGWDCGAQAPRLVPRTWPASTGKAKRPRQREKGQSGGAPASWCQAIRQSLADGKRRAIDVESGGRAISLDVVPVPAAGYANLYGRDVTEQREAESQREAALQEIRHTEERLKTLLDVLPVGVSILDDRGCVLSANDALATVLDLPADRILAGDYARRSYTRADGTPMPPDEFPAARALRDQQPVHNVEIGIAREDGETIWTSVSAAPVPLPDVAVVVVTADITAHKRAEEEARTATTRAEQLAAENLRQREFLDKTLDTMHEAVVVYDVDGGIVRANRAAVAAYGADAIKAGAAADIHKLRIRHVDDRPVTVDELPAQRALRGEMVQGEYYRFTDPKGQEHTVVASGAPLQGPDGSDGAVAVWRDVTERERLLAELEAIFAVIPHSLVVFDADGRILRSNQATDTLFRLTPADRDLTAGERAAARIYTDATGRRLTAEQMPLGRALRGEVVHDEILALRTVAGGPPTWLSVSASPLRYPSGSVLGAGSAFPVDAAKGRGTSRGAWPLFGPEGSGDQVVGAVLASTDITALKSAQEQAEAAREEANRRAAELDAALEALPVGVLLYEPDGHIHRMNGVAERIVRGAGASPGAPLEERVCAARNTHLDGRVVLPEEAPAYRALRGETVRADIMVVNWGDRKTWLSAGAAPIRGPEGRVLGAVGVLTDVTELREAQEQLEQANEELRLRTQQVQAAREQAEAAMHEAQQRAGELDAVFEAMVNGLLIYGPHAQVVRANNAARRMLNADAAYEQLPVAEQMRVRRLSWPDGRPVAAKDAPVARALNGEVTRSQVLVMYPAGDDAPTWISMSAAPLHGPDGKVAGAVANVIDVTHLRLTQERLQQVIQQLEVRSEQLEMQTEEMQAQNAELAQLSAELEDQRARLEAVVQQMPAGVLIATAPSGRVVLMNRQAEEMLRGPYSLPEGPADYMRYESFYPDGRPYRPEEMPLARTMASGEQVLNEEIHFVRGDGTRGVQIASSGPVRNRQGQITAGVLVFNDITERKAMEEALRQAEERYRTFIEHSSEGIWRVELERPILTELPESMQVRRLYAGGYLAECNETLAGMHGFASAREAHGTRLGQLVPSLSRANVRYLRSFVRSGYRLPDVESTELDRDGGTRYFSNTLIGIVDPKQKALIRLWGIKRDITERKQIEDDLRRARDELATLLAIAERVAAALDLQSFLDDTAELLQELVDYTGLSVYRLEERQRVTLVAYRGPALLDQVIMSEQPMPSIRIETVAQALAEGRPAIVPDLLDDSEPAWTWQAAVPPETQGLAGPARSWMLVPLTVQGRLAGVLRLTHQEPGRFTQREAGLALAFANHVAIAIENARLNEEAKEVAIARERQRLARDLHDVVSQTLFSASIITDVLPTVYGRDPQHGQDLLVQLREMQRGAMAEMRALLLELRPAALLAAEVGALLRQLAEAVTGRSRIPIAVDTNGLCKLPPDAHVAFYRIAQEALNNIAKHSAAGHAALTLSCVPGSKGDGTAISAMLQITDDGRGFDPQAMPKDRLGMGIMAERARSIGAALEVQSAPGQGTSITVVWPAGD